MNKKELYNRINQVFEEEVGVGIVWIEDDKDEKYEYMLSFDDKYYNPEVVNVVKEIIARFIDTEWYDNLARTVE